MHHNSPLLPEYKRDTKTRNNINYMVLGARVQSQKYKIRKESNHNNFRHLQNPVTPECHMSMTLHFNVINKCGQKVSNKCDVYDDEQTDSVNNPQKKGGKRKS